MSNEVSKLPPLKTNTPFNPTTHPQRMPSSSSAIPNSPSAYSYSPPSTAVFLKWYQIQNLSAGAHNFKGIYSPHSSRPWSTSYMLGNVLHSANAAPVINPPTVDPFSFLAHQSWNELLTSVETSESISNLQWGLKSSFREVQCVEPFSLHSLISPPLLAAPLHSPRLWGDCA